MKVITRKHNFENILDLIRKGRKYYYLFHEKSTKGVRVKRNGKLDKAFREENWKAFEDAEKEEF